MLGGFKLVRRMVSGHEKDTNGANVSNVDEKATSIKSKRLKCLKDYIKKDLQRLRYKFTYKAQKKIIINIPISQIIKVGRSRTRKWATIKSSSPIQHTTRDSEQVRSRQTSALTPDWKNNTIVPRWKGNQHQGLLSNHDQSAAKTRFKTKTEMLHGF